MNHVSARARNNRLFWIGEFRCARHADFRPVLEGEEVARLPNKVEAQLAAHRALPTYMNGRLRRDGATISSARIAAEKLFRSGKKPIPVEVTVAAKLSGWHAQPPRSFGVDRLWCHESGRC